MDKQQHAKLTQILNPDFETMDSMKASQFINKITALINGLEWQSNNIDQSVYDKLNAKYSDQDTINERLKLISNTFDQDDFLLSIIDQLRDKVNDNHQPGQLYVITLSHHSTPLNDEEIQNLVSNHSITIRKVTSNDVYQLIQLLKKLLGEAQIKY